MSATGGWRTRWVDDRAEPGAIVACNAVSLVGVLVWGWRLDLVMLVYWLDNGIVGLLNVPKMLLAARPGSADEGALAESVLSVGFFVLHYGAFFLAHGFFVVALFVDGTPASVLAGSQTVLLGVAALAVQRSSEAYHEYRSGRFREVTPTEQQYAPYARAVILHVTILFGGFLVAALGAPVAALAVLVVLKTGYDLLVLARNRDDQPESTE